MRGVFSLFCYKMWPWWWGICLCPFSINQLKYMDIHIWCRLVGTWSLRGLEQTLLLSSKRFYMHHLTVHFERSTIWNWFSSLHAIENHCRPNKFGHGGPARNVCVSCLRHCDERMRVNKCIAISGAQEFTSCPPNAVTPPAVLPNLVPFLLEIRSQLA